MKFLALFASVAAVATATEYSALKQTISEAPFHTMRLTELQATVAKKGPMDEVGALCYKQMREILAEVDELDSTHLKFTTQCKTTLDSYRNSMTARTRAVGKYDAYAAAKSKQWNNMRTKIPPMRRQRETYLARLTMIEKRLVILHAQRAETKKVYDADMVDFSKALQDIDELKKILTNSNLNNKQTSGNVAQQGFLQILDKTQSDKLRAVASRITLGHQALVEEPSGVDKVMNLLLQVRNEMWAEMDKLTKAEARSVNTFRNQKQAFRSMINRYHVYRARIYVQIGRTLTDIGTKMLSEAKDRISSATTTKRLDQTEINRQFLKASCDAELPYYNKARSTKMAEVQTIQSMLKILKNLNWSGAVYNAISRISVGVATDGNPEPGYTMGYQMNVATGLNKNIYEFTNDVKGFSRVAIKLEIGSEWVWASFDAFTDDATRYKIPTLKSGLVNQRKVNNLHVYASASAKVEQGAKIASAYIEQWANNYGRANVKKVPKASDGLYDGGDQRSAQGSYGCFQVFNAEEGEMVLSVNHLLHSNADVGIGNNPDTRKGQNPDWTYAKNLDGYRKGKQRVYLTMYFLEAKGK